ncbi:hypothetical protein GF380_02090 [Candidatus Uhrbacteria bacterium]|nr:hypothetical protein [Candidatus Uhrbacteria bacterium]
MCELIADWRKRKQARKKYFLKYVYGWRLRDCTTCNGSGYYDSTGSPPCGTRGGTGRVAVYTEKPESWLYCTHITTVTLKSCIGMWRAVGRRTIGNIGEVCPDWRESLIEL